MSGLKGLFLFNNLTKNNDSIYTHLMFFNFTYYGNMVWPNLMAVIVVVLVVAVYFEEKFVPNVMLVPFVFILS